MRVLFANPPILSGSKRFNRPIRFPTFSYATQVMHPPLLLAYAAAFVRPLGHDVLLIDAPVLSMSPEEFFRSVEKYTPDFIVFETSTASFNNDAHVVAEAKKRVDSKAIFVGSHVSSIPRESLRRSNADAVVMGEYEYTLSEYIQKGPEGTEGVAYKNKEGEIVVNPQREPPRDLDSFPFPARDLLDNYKYFDPILKNPFTFVLSGRGCPFRCTFCNWPQLLWGHTYRVRSPANVCNELEDIGANYNFKSFLFNDDTFTVDRNHAIAVCDETLKRGLEMEWACYARPDLNDRRLLGKLRRAGCFLLKVGVESGNQQVLNNMKKGTTIDRIKEGVKIMKEMGFHVHATFLFGMPGETEESIDQTIEFAKELDPTTVQFSTAVPYPGTEFYMYLKKNGFFLTEDWSKMMPLEVIYEYPDLSSEKIRDAVRTAYRRYYFRRRYIAMGLKGILSEPTRFVRNFYGLLRFTL